MSSAGVARIVPFTGGTARRAVAAVRQTARVPSTCANGPRLMAVISGRFPRRCTPNATVTLHAQRYRSAATAYVPQSAVPQSAASLACHHATLAPPRDHLLSLAVLPGLSLVHGLHSTSIRLVHFVFLLQFATVCILGWVSAVLVSDWELI